MRTAKTHMRPHTYIHTVTTAATQKPNGMGKRTIKKQKQKKNIVTMFSVHLFKLDEIFL